MAAVQFDNGVDLLVAVSPPCAGTKATSPRRLRAARVRRARRIRRLYAISRYEVAVSTASGPEPEDHWDDGARASLATVGVTYRR